MKQHSAYNELLKRHWPMVWRMCWVSALGNFERCRDLVQEVSIALWLHFDKLRSNATTQEEKAWVRALTRTTLDHQRRGQKPPLVALTDAMTATIPDTDTSRMSEDIEELMALLGEDERQLMRLRIEGYRADEIAGMMGLTRDTVFQRMHRAVAKVRRLALVLAALLCSSAVAIAVVPQWRQALFGKAKEALPPVDSIEPAATVDTTTTKEVPIVPKPKPAPRTRTGKMEHLEPLELEADAPPESVHDIPTVAVDGNRLTVSGVYGERVSVYSRNGSLLASQMCNGICTMTILPDNSRMLASGRYGDFVVRIGDRLEVIVTQ